MRIVALAAALMSALLPLRSQPPALDQTIESIQAAIEKGDQAAASRLLDEALRQYPQEAGLFNLRGVVHAQQSQIEQARADFERAVHLKPSLMPAWRNLARACQLLTDPSANACAADAWRHVLRAAPADPEAATSLATVYEWQGKFTESLREIDKLPPAEIGRSAVLALRCADLHGLGRTQEATLEAQRLVQAADFSESDAAAVFPVFESKAGAPLVVTLVEALDTQGKASAVSLRRLGVAYEQLDRLSDARRVLERVALLEPNNPSHLLELARVAYHLRDLEGCLGYLGHARDLTPSDAKIHFLFGLVTVELNLPLEARKSLEKAVALDPANPDFHYSLGAVLLASGNAADALPHFEKYVGARPNDARGHFALGAAYFESADYSRCREQMLAVSRDPKTQAGAAYFLGRVARIDENYSEAQAYLEKVIRLLPSFAEGYTELARVHLRQGQLDAARAAILKALELDPDSFHANSTLLALYQRTQDPRADEQAERIKTLDAQRSKRQELMLRTIEVRPY